MLKKIINRSTVDPQEVTALWEGPTSRLTVTGECGDQIFGSQLLEVERGGQCLRGWECFRWGSFFFGRKRKHKVIDEDEVSKLYFEEMLKHGSMVVTVSDFGRCNQNPSSVCSGRFYSSKSTT